MERRCPNAILEVMGFAGLIALYLLWYYPFDKYSAKSEEQSRGEAGRRLQPEQRRRAHAAASLPVAVPARWGDASVSSTEWCGFWQAPCRLMSANPLMLPFLSIIMCIGYLFGTIDGYLALWVVQLGGTSGLVGAMYALASIVEIPLFFYSDRVYRWVGMRVILFISCAAYTSAS